MKALGKKICIAPGCTTRAGHDNNTHCHTHAIDKTNPKKNKCIVPGCNTSPSYGFPNKPVAKCAKHKEDGMVTSQCHVCDWTEDGKRCQTRASFGKVGGKKCRCVMHKEDGMVDLVSRMCEIEGCDTQATFGNPPIRCVRHKEDDMVGKYGKCKQIGCTVNASFGLPNGRTTHCGTHKTDDMIQVYGRKCVSDGCQTQPTYGLPNGKAEYCASHRLKDMVDVVNEICEHPECKTLANYGPLFGERRHCAKHKSGNEFLKNNPKCEAGLSTCDRPYYADDGSNYPKRCEAHKTLKDKNIIERECSSCKLQYFIREGATMCGNCEEFQAVGPRKAREMEVKEALDNAGIRYITSDKRVLGGCSNKRPDFVIDNGTFMIIVECDEDQHRIYTKECELKRMYTIGEDLGGIPCIFVRYNPDSYKDSSNKAHRYSKYRVAELIKTVQGFMKLPELGAPRMVAYMFYDGYNNALTPVKHISLVNGEVVLT